MGGAIGKGGTKKEIIDAGTHNVTSRPTGTMVYAFKDKIDQVKSGSMVFTGKEFWGCGNKDNGEPHIKWTDVKIEEKIGEGSYGLVFKARYIPNNKRCALKEALLSPDPAENAEILDDFKKEVAILQIVRHERIVHFLGSIDDPINKKHCMLFEPCAGSVGSLLKTVTTKKVTLTFRLLYQIAVDAVEACVYLHDLDPCVIHRDLKAENLLLDDSFRCLLSDFGLSRPFERKLDAQKHMTICGTPCWVAPEIFRGDEYSEKVDVYSFGVVLWELFATIKPYADIDGMELPFKVVKEGLRPPPLTHCPPALNELMQKCFIDDTESTPKQKLRPSFKELRDMLEGDVGDQLRSAGAFEDASPLVMDTKKPWDKQKQ